MTARRNFKKLVRERMARTGEAYSTAARHLTGPPVPGSHRDSVLTGHLLAAAGQPLSEPLVCGLGGGIGFMYAVFEYAAVPHPLLTIVAQHHPEPWAPAALGRLGVAYTQTTGTSAKAALDRLRAALGDGRPALCTVDRSRLPWQSAPQFSSAEPYPVAVIALTGDLLTVLDPPYGVRELDLASFAAAWTAHRQGRHRLLAVTGGPSTVDLRAAARDAITVTVGHLTGPVLGNSFDVNFGFSGMAGLAAELRDTRTRKGWSQRFASPAAREQVARRLPECLEREYTAPGATRPLYAAFLDEAATLPTGPTPAQAPDADRLGTDAGPAPDALRRAAELFRDSGRTWSALAAHAASAPDADLRTWCDEAADLVDAALTTERTAAALLTPAA
ncbi:hypothetical protein CS0771_29740 [Catellatospora sp. IY07-71]|uniref:BtrH N-terminal domain-containing protein n=1 Tax=Catellatospora sp. IY07-71 TaxID=2728827 RepID=UPI001BB3C6AA|nr:BtrH N-terminal domain-containing protein [Catellatospora sp. IY07-71]BCJ73430.1 hypothetical protein CS0771_29740 [Catellatospora sp. IY07-71]